MVVGSSPAILKNMSRSNWKSIISSKICSQYTYNRNWIILPSYIGKTIYVHQGKNFIPIHITSSHVGHKLGEFSYTKYPAKYKTKKN